MNYKYEYFLRNISDYRKVISKVCDQMIQNSSFEQLEVQRTWYDSSKERSPRYLRDPVEALQYRIYILDKTENLVCRTVDKNHNANGS